jgi:hypothetical protein
LILYHFSTVALVRPDLTPGDAALPPEGLVPSAAEAWTPAAVWLTTDKEPGRAAAASCLRVTVVIPTTDRKLIQFSRLKASRLMTDLPPDFLKRARRDWWLYRGNVLPERCASIEIIRGQQPWWVEPD